MELWFHEPEKIVVHLVTTISVPKILEEKEDLHRACGKGSLRAVESTVQRNKLACYAVDRDGQTPLHFAAMDGNVEVLEILLNAPDAVIVVNSTSETFHHTAVGHSKWSAVEYLFTWIESSKSSTYLTSSLVAAAMDEPTMPTVVVYNTNKGEAAVQYSVKCLGGTRTDLQSFSSARDHYGNTILHLAASRRQHQRHSLFFWRTSNILFTGTHKLYVDALNFGDFKPKNMLPYGEKIDMKIEKIPPGETVSGKNLSNHENMDSGVVLHGNWGRSRPSKMKSIWGFTNYRRQKEYNTLLLVATFVATVTFQAAVGFSSSTFKEIYLSKDEDVIIVRSIITLNSFGFIASVVTVMILLHKFPYKPWPQIALFALFGAYICLVKAMIPQLALPLFLLSVPFLLTGAAAGNFVLS